MSKQKKIYFPKTRLAELAARAGGIGRDQAVEGALESLQAMRGESDRKIANAVAELEAVVLNARSGQISAEEISLVLRRSDLIVTLAGTFDYEALERAAKSLCDVADGLVRAGLFHSAPIAVHVQSMKLLTPGERMASPDEAEKILTELAKILAHYKFGSLAFTADSQDLAASA
jgi:hypothetical protein